MIEIDMPPFETRFGNFKYLVRQDKFRAFGLDELREVLNLVPSKTQTKSNLRVIGFPKTTRNINSKVFHKIVIFKDEKLNKYYCADLVFQKSFKRPCLYYWDKYEEVSTGLWDIEGKTVNIPRVKRKSILEANLLKAQERKAQINANNNT